MNAANERTRAGFADRLLLRARLPVLAAGCCRGRGCLFWRPAAVGGEVADSDQVAVGGEVADSELNFPYLGFCPLIVKNNGRIVRCFLIIPLTAA
ncbi:hypothetical protein AN477_12915 [Alicyclobacillus ferrooxydans]|uniref:Uncharacterized protein n=1 Tax=Alicyclobacillus ferrooxydans TaxID=471514 RepID=A0A0P9CCJ6_9BACL|nr:hypothetical protein AN477_12915 [Alicyclobacillus ferrooxydans]